MRCSALAAPLLLLAFGVLLIGVSSANAQVVAGSAVYVRHDTDRTTVIAPRLHVGAPVTDATRLDVVYTTDIWTSASIDIRASASKAVTEQRDELSTTLTHELGDLTLNGTYRYSHESDYLSHGGTLGGSLNFADNSATLDLRLSGAFDQVGRAGDPHFHRPARNLGARLGFTQVLDQQTLVQLIYELMDAHGYNSSPYRFIGIGTPNGLCTTPPNVAPSPQCIPEANPSERLRHAVAANLRRAFGESMSVGLGYRFYIDDWHLMSHTVLADVSLNVSAQLLLSLRYRFYVQGDAGHYRSSYDPSDPREYYTNDKELSAFMSHRLSLDIERSFDLDALGHKLAVILAVAPSRFVYSNYRPVTDINALEVTLATVFKL